MSQEMTVTPEPTARTRRRVVALGLGLALVLGLGACTGSITPSGGNGDGEMKGAGGRDISEYWASIGVPLSENTRMLSFEMMRNEVQRATGLSWVVAGVDQWEKNRGALGGADYVTTFADDLTPSQQRLVLWRKMAFQVCGDLVAAEAGAKARTVFQVVDPGASVDPSAATTTDQIRALFHRFFLADADATDLSEAATLLTALGSDGATAWRGLCVAYLGSMRFLTY